MKSLLRTDFMTRDQTLMTFGACGLVTGGYTALGRVPTERPVIQGLVNVAYEAIIRLTVQGPSGERREIEAVVDTGYNGFLTLPQDLVTELSLVYRDRGRAILANGSEVFFDTYDVAVLWDNRLRNTRASVANTTPHVQAMALLDRHSLYVGVENGGRVVIQARD